MQLIIQGGTRCIPAGHPAPGNSSIKYWAQCVEPTANLRATFSLGKAGWHGSQTVRETHGSGMKMS